MRESIKAAILTLVFDTQWTTRTRFISSTIIKLVVLAILLYVYRDEL